MEFRECDIHTVTCHMCCRDHPAMLLSCCFLNAASTERGPLFEFQQRPCALLTPTAVCCSCLCLVLLVCSGDPPFSHLFLMARKEGNGYICYSYWTCGACWGSEYDTPKVWHFGLLSTRTGDQKASEGRPSGLPPSPCLLLIEVRIPHTSSHRN